MGEKSDKKGGENELLLSFPMSWADVSPVFQVAFQIILLNRAIFLNDDTGSKNFK